jgi:tetratricopeptide (TPR) repeat protein
MEKMLALPFNDWTFRRAMPYVAAAYMKTGQFQRIADYFKRHAAEIPDLFYLLLQAYIQLQNPPLAEKLLFEADKYFPVSAAANWPCAFFSPYLGKYRRSIEAFDEMEKMSWQAIDTARVVDVKIFKALYFVWGWNDFNRAWLELEKALQYPAYIPYWKNVALLYAYRGDFVRAESLAVQKETPGMQQFIRLFIHSGKHECNYAKAIADSLFPSQPEHIRTWALYPLAQCQFETGQYEAALTSLLQIQKSSDNVGGFHAVYYPKSFYLMGKTYEKKGDKKLAIQNYEKLLELWKSADADLPELIETKARLAALRRR